MLDFLVSSAFITSISFALVFVWRFFRRVLGDPYESMPLHSVETAEESMRLAKRRRVAAEHQLWDSEFHAGIHSRLDCSCLDGDSHRPAARWQRHRQ